MVKVSVIVPAYNAEKTLGECLESLLHQDYENYEIIVVDDGSTDNTKGVAEAHKDERLIYVYQPNRGVSAARNAGLQYARGDVIGFCDSDDTYEPNALEIVRQAFLSLNVDAVVVGFQHAQASESELQIVRVCTLPSDRVCSFEDLMNLIFTRNDAIMGTCWGKFFKKDLVKSIRFDETLTHCEDMHFVFQVLSHHKDCVCAIIVKPLYNYIVHPFGESATQPKDKAALFKEDGTYRYIAAFQAIERDCHLTDRQREYLRSLTTIFAIGVLWDLRCWREPIYEKQIPLIKDGLLSFLFGQLHTPIEKVKAIVKLALLRMRRICAVVIGQKLT